MESDPLLVCAIASTIQKHRIGPFRQTELLQSLFPPNNLPLLYHFFSILASHSLCQLPDFFSPIHVRVASRGLHVFLRFIPVRHPSSPTAAASSSPSAVRTNDRLAHGPILPSTSVEILRLVRQFILVNDAALLLAGVFYVCPCLFFARGKYSCVVE